MKFGEVYDYRTAEAARAFIGKEGVFSDSLKSITESPMQRVEGTLWKVEKEEGYPFYVDDADDEGYPFYVDDADDGGYPFYVDDADDGGFQFFRPILEEDEPLMTNRQLAEWIAKGNGEFVIGDGMLVATDYSYSKSSVDKPVPDRVLIRRWKDTEWVKPTRTIYEEDC